MKMSKIISILFLMLAYFNVCEANSPKVICFYANWAQFRPGIGRFLPQSIDPKLCTHVTYAHLKIDLSSHRLAQRQKNDHILLAQINDLKKINPLLKVIISVGGWNHERKPRFSKMVQNTTTRGIFIESAISYMQTHSLDGISIDWEYPTHRGTSVPEDKHRYTLLLKEFKEAVTKQSRNFTISASVSAGRRIISTAYEITEISKYVDWVNVMAYALHGAWEDETGHHTAMAGGIPNVPDSLKAWQELGMPNDKINIGLATYGRSFTLLFSDEYGLNAPAVGAGKAGPFTRGKGILSYFEFCNQTWSHVTPYYRSVARKPYASHGDQWIGYESPESIAYEVKTLLTENKGIHGVAVWALGYDDFSGKFCHEGKFPLLRAVLKGIVESQISRSRFVIQN